MEGSDKKKSGVPKAKKATPKPKPVPKPKAAPKPKVKPVPKAAPKIKAKPTKAAPKVKAVKKSPAKKAAKKPAPKKAPAKAKRPSKRKLHKVPVFDAEGKAAGDVALPPVFETPVRRDLIRQAVVTAQANRRQPYGPSPDAGMRHAVATWGKGRGTARVQRLKNGRTAAESPPNVGGRRAHPPKVEEDKTKKMNRKERLLARKSALAATSHSDIVSERGHRFEEGMKLPVVVDDAMATMETTKEVRTLLESIGVWDDVVRAKEGRKIRAGRGKMRGRRYKTPKSLLIVTTDPSRLLKSARNLPGVDIITPQLLNAELLAPGGDPGRLTLFTKSAIEEVGKWQ